VEPDSSDLDNALVAKLSSDPELLSLMPNGVYFSLAPEKSTQYVLVSLAESEDVPMFGGRAFETYVYAVKAVELSTVATRNIKAASARIDAILDPPPPAPPLALTIPGYSLKLSRRRDRIRYEEIDEVDRSIRWSHRGAEYVVWVAPLASASREQRRRTNGS
jgi:hypothetical protein